MSMKSSVLVIDDDPSFRSFVKSILEHKQDYEVIEAADVEGGLDAAAKGLPQLIILDLMMPHKSGQDFLVEARTNEAIKHIPVLVCSGRDSELDARRCRILGAVGFIPKPFELEDFRFRVRKAVGH